MHQSIIVDQLLFLAILVLIGYVASKIGVIRDETRDSLVKIIFNITLPLLLITNFSNIDLTPEILANSLLVIVISAVTMLLMLLTGLVSSLPFRLKHEQRSVFIAHHGFGNILYFGFPVVSALLGEMGLFYASIYAFVSIMMLWTVGIYVITRKGGMSARESMKKMVNPNSVAIIAGFILFLLGWDIPGVLLKPFVALGGTTIYLSMLYIGALLGLMKIGGILRNRLAIVTTLNKNILFPAILILIIYLLSDSLFSNTDPVIISVVILEAAMPCMANVVIVARIFKVDDQLATANVFLSTLLSLVTLPLVWWFASLLLS